MLRDGQSESLTPVLLCAKAGGTIRQTIFLDLCCNFLYEPRHEKTNKMSVRPAKTKISLGIRPFWSESSLCAQWVAKDPSFLHADSEGWSESLSWAHTHFVGFVISWLIFSLFQVTIYECQKEGKLKLLQAYADPCVSLTYLCKNCKDYGQGLWISQKLFMTLVSALHKLWLKGLRTPTAVCWPYLFYLIAFDFKSHCLVLF